MHSKKISVNKTFSNTGRRRNVSPSTRSQYGSAHDHDNTFPGASTVLMPGWTGNSAGSSEQFADDIHTHRILGGNHSHSGGNNKHTHSTTSALAVNYIGIHGLIAQPETVVDSHTHTLLDLNSEHTAHPSEDGTIYGYNHTHSRTDWRPLVTSDGAGGTSQFPTHFNHNHHMWYYPETDFGDDHGHPGNAPGKRRKPISSGLMRRRGGRVNRRMRRGGRMRRGY